MGSKRKKEKENRSRKSCTHLIHSQHLPLNVAELLRIAKSEFISGQKHIQLELLIGGSELIFANNLARWSSANVSDDVKIWRPSLKLRLPRSDGREWHNHQVRSVLMQLVEKV